MNKSILAVAIGASLLTTPCFAGDDRPAKPTDSIPSWKDVLDSSMLVTAYPGWTPPPTREYPFVPPEQREPEEEKVCITVTEARALVQILENAAQQEAELDATVKTLDEANKRINFLEAQLYESEHNLSDLQKRYVKLQESVLFPAKQTPPR